jgi:serine protease
LPIKPTSSAYRATSDVVINGSKEKKGVKNALVGAGNRSDVKVISMSIGDVFSSGTVKDGVRYAYNRGKLIVAAAGTSLTWTSWVGVIFPANMNETTAVTGIRDGSPMQRCNTCHDGSKVDFVAVMQRRSNTDRTSLTLSRSNNNPGYVGGSSAATATTAGIAALVWATNPSQSRSQVLNRMKQAASFYPGRNGSFGWGIIDANQAVRVSSERTDVSAATERHPEFRMALWFFTGFRGKLHQIFSRFGKNRSVFGKIQ